MNTHATQESRGAAQIHSAAELVGIFNAAGQGWSGWGAVARALNEAVAAARAEGAAEAGAS